MVSRYNQIGEFRRDLARDRKELAEKLLELDRLDAKLANEQRKIFEKKFYSETKSNLGFLKFDPTKIFISF